MKMHITQLIIVFLLVFVSSCSVNGLAVEEIDIEFTIPSDSLLIDKAIKISRTSDPLYNDITMNGTIKEELNTLEYSGSADSPIAGYSESTNSTILLFTLEIYDVTSEVISKDLSITIQRTSDKNSSFEYNDTKELEVNNELVNFDISISYRYGAWY